MTRSSTTRFQTAFRPNATQPTPSSSLSRSPPSSRRLRRATKTFSRSRKDLPQEKEDNRHDPEGKKAALKLIIADYNQQYGTNHDINNFDLYYQDVQQRIKDQQFPNREPAPQGRGEDRHHHRRRHAPQPASTPST